MGQKDLCEKSLEALKNIQNNAKEIKNRSDDMKLIFSDINNFPSVEYLNAFKGKLERLKDDMISINGQLLTLHTGAATQKRIADQKKK
jgi:hypothetical protein